ncbi:hypothetical protein [Paraburkholderia sp. SIMBA_053]|uniref:hypothetical protein n=1 Tax=Paraburkholderia sp. SIMBA_053 TaxID=3085794 RepID=UPI00397D8354
MSIDKKLVQIAQDRYVDSGLTKDQGGTHGSIQHPSGNDPNLAVARVNMDDPTSATLLNISNLDATTIQRMPTIVDFNFLHDMGRTNGNWPSDATTGCLPAHFVPVNVRLQS